MYGLVRAPEIDRAGFQWFNVERPLSLRSVRGRIVILDFWTFCCVNCMHVLPALRRVEEAFPHEVVVIGVHSPKFPAERDAANLRHAIARYEVRHPVVHDPALTLWKEYAVRAWPTLVLISPDGHVIGQLAGEPDPDLLLRGVGDMVHTFFRRGEITPGTLPLAYQPLPPSGRLRFPGKIKPLPGSDLARWAVADAGHHQVLLLGDDGTEVARIGSGEAGFADGPAAEAAFCAPQGVAATKAAVYVADTGNHALRRVDRRDGRVRTIAGLGCRGMPLTEEADGLRTPLASPWDVAVFRDRLVFANAGTHQLATFDPVTGRVAPLAGTGAESLVDGPATEAVLAQPSGLAADSGHALLYFVDSETSSVRRLTLAGTPVVETLVGSGLFAFGDADGPFAEAQLQHPLGLACVEGGLVVADSYNHCLRFLDLAARTVTTLGPDAACEQAAAGCHGLSEPAGVWRAGPHRLLISDTNNHRIVEWRLDTGRLRTWFR